MSILDLLLETDIKKLELKFSKDFEVKRLSEKIGKPFVVSCSPMTNDQLTHISEVSKNNSDMKIHVVIECCKIEGKKIATKELMEKFNVITAFELVQKLFLPGEIYEMYTQVNNMSGYGEGAVEEIKNS